MDYVDALQRGPADRMTSEARSLEASAYENQLWSRSSGLGASSMV